MRSVVRHRFTLALSAAALALLGCTVSDVGEKTPASDSGAAASAQAPPPGQTSAATTPGAVGDGTAGAAAVPAGAATTPTGGGTGAAAATGSNMSPDSVDVGARGKSDSLSSSTMRLEVNLATRTLTVFDHDKAVATHRVAVGSPEWPTKTGDWNVKQVVWNPEWIPPDETWAEQRTPKKPGAPDNPLGRAQLVYDPPRTIHGTNEPASIGKAVSHGSIRLPNAVVTRLARQLMEATGAGKDDAWYDRVQQNRTEKVVVDLPQRVPIRVY
jgi:lipoprotein-anchoring transpeptidase ErfK/SrfK